MSYAYTCTFSLDDCLRHLGLEERGRVQQAVDSAFLEICDPYLPFDQGYLKHSGIANTVIGSGEVAWNCDNKARRLYYGENSWDWSNGGVQQGGTRGPYWAARAMQDGGITQLEAIARRETGR